MKSKKKNFIIPLVLIIIIIIILVIVLTKTNKKDKFDYSMSELKADPIIPIVKNFKFKFTNNNADNTCFVEIKKRNKPNDEINDKVILSKSYDSLSGSEFISVPYDSHTIQLIVSTRMNDIEDEDKPINIYNPEFDYNIFKIFANSDSTTILSIPNIPIIDYGPKFRFVNMGDITFEYKIKIINADSGNILLETKNYNNNCNYYDSDIINVPNNSIVFITYRSCSLPGFEKTVKSGTLYNGKRYTFDQTAKFSFWRGTWYPNLIFREN